MVLVMAVLGLLAGAYMKIGNSRGRGLHSRFLKGSKKT
jgi:hypothetical protein